MKLIHRPALLGLLLAICNAAGAAYITDKLLAGLYPGPAADGQPTRLLSSGTSLKLLEKRKVFHRVRLDDGTEGWVNAAYLTEEKPARAMLLEAQGRIKQLEEQLDAAQRQSGSATTPGCPELLAIDSTDGDAPTSAAGGAAAPQTAAADPVPVIDCDAVTGELQAELAALRGRVSNAVVMLGANLDSGSRTEHGSFAIDDLKDWRRYWHVYALPVALLTGLACGIAFMDYRSRRRYGGVRV